MTTERFDFEEQPVVPNTSDTDNPKCTCCEPPNYLEPPMGGRGNWICPRTGFEYSYDPAEGTPHRVSRAREERDSGTRTSDQDFFPQTPSRERMREVNPREPFA